MEGNNGLTLSAQKRQGRNLEDTCRLTSGNVDIPALIYPDKSGWTLSDVVSDACGIISLALRFD